MNEPSPKRRKQRFTLIVLIIFTVIYLLLLVPAGLLAMMFPFAFDSGATTEAYTVAILLLTFPIALILAPIIAWILYKFKQYIAALVFILLPLVYFLLAVFVFE